MTSRRVFIKAALATVAFPLMGTARRRPLARCPGCGKFDHEVTLGFIHCRSCWERESRATLALWQDHAEHVRLHTEVARKYGIYT